MIVLSKEKLDEVNTFENCEPHLIEVLDDYDDLSRFLSFKSHSLGYPSVDKYLQREKLYMYEVSEPKRLTTIGH